MFLLLSFQLVTLPAFWRAGLIYRAMHPLRATIVGHPRTLPLSTSSRYQVVLYQSFLAIFLDYPTILMVMLLLLSWRMPEAVSMLKSRRGQWHTVDMNVAVWKLVLELLKDVPCILVSPLLLWRW